MKEGPVVDQSHQRGPKVCFDGEAMGRHGTGLIHHTVTMMATGESIGNAVMFQTSLATTTSACYLCVTVCEGGGGGGGLCRNLQVGRVRGGG